MSEVVQKRGGLKISKSLNYFFFFSINLLPFVSLAQDLFKKESFSFSPFRKKADQIYIYLPINILQ